MNPDEGIVAILKADTVTDSMTGGRVFPDAAPQLDEENSQVTLPYIIVSFQGGEDLVCIGGPLGQPQASWQITVYDEDPDRCATLAAFARGSLNGYAGVSGGIQFDALWADTPRSDIEEDDASPAGYWFVRRFEVSGFYTETLDPLSYGS